mgnify:CR=1 FL=1
MIIAVIGSAPALSAVEFIMKEYKTDFKLRYYTVKLFEDSAVIAEKVQREGLADALLFSGPTNYNYTRSKVKETIPWGCIPHTKSSIYQGIAEAGVRYNTDDFDCISVDSYEPDLFRNALEGLGIRDMDIIYPSRHFSEQEYEKGLLEFHRTQHRKNPRTICFTNMEHIHEPLVEEGIPCIRLRPSEESIREQLSALRLRSLSVKESRGVFAVIAVRYSFEFDSEQDITLREWMKMEYMNAVRKRCYETAQRLDAAVFQQGVDMFILTTARDTLINVFIKGGEYMKLMNYNTASKDFNMWMGIGTGHTMVEAYSHAAISLNKALKDYSGGIVMTDTDNPVPVEIEIPSYEDSDAALLAIAHRTHINLHTLQKIRNLQEEQKNLTSQMIAKALDMNIRNVNRIVAKMDEGGYVVIVGKQSTGKGRPERVFKFSF